MEIGFDLISDLHLLPDDVFNWENKATSLYCIIAGNVSHDLRTIAITLTHLSKFYQGVFYSPGTLEYENMPDIDSRTNDIIHVCNHIRNVAVLHQRVVIIDGVAILGCNGWYGIPDLKGSAIAAHLDDIHYLKKSLEKLQRHLDVTKILLVSSSVPRQELYYGEEPPGILAQYEPAIALMADTEHKVSHWAFGTYKKNVDTVINDINYITNPYYKLNPYWAKRIAVEV
jgi:hypothetical protein